MKRLAPVTAIVALLATIAAISPLTTASGQAGGETLKFSARLSDGQFHPVDADNSGDETPGDYFVGNFALRHGGKGRGHLEFRCDVVTEAPDRNLCAGVVHINGRGEISVTDVSPSDSETEKVTITGGIGDFGGAGGNGKFEFGRNRATFTFKIK
jgi:hypothetical protein